MTKELDRRANAARLWDIMREALGGDPFADKHRRILATIAADHINERKVGTLSKTRAERLAKIAALCQKLNAAIAQEREWLCSHVNDDITDPFAEDLIERGSPSALSDLAAGISSHLKKHPTDSGRAAVAVRHRTWAALAMIYQHSSGREPAVSKKVSRDGPDQIVGPFVRFITSFSEMVGEKEQVSPNAVETFVEWYRHEQSELVRREVKELLDLRMALASAACDSDQRKLN